MKVFKKNSLDISYELEVSIDYSNAIITYERTFIPKNNVNNEDNVGNLEA